MKVRVDSEKCQGHTLCAMSAPEIFMLRDEDGHAYVEAEDVPPEHEAAVRKAELGCPEQAIEVFELKEG